MPGQNTVYPRWCQRVSPNNEFNEHAIEAIRLYKTLGVKVLWDVNPTVETKRVDDVCSVAHNPA